jgi:hypothetical protein
LIDFSFYCQQSLCYDWLVGWLAGWLVGWFHFRVVVTVCTRDVPGVKFTGFRIPEPDFACWIPDSEIFLPFIESHLQTIR